MSSKIMTAKIDPKGKGLGLLSMLDKHTAAALKWLINYSRTEIIDFWLIKRLESLWEIVISR